MTDSKLTVTRYPGSDTINLTWGNPEYSLNRITVEIADWLDFVQAIQNVNVREYVITRKLELREAFKELSDIHTVGDSIELPKGGE